MTPSFIRIDAGARWCARRLLGLVLLLVIAAPAGALLRIDFEPPYFVHPGMQVWDFCVVLSDGTYHLFYHGIPELNPSPAAADHIWRATSPDLVHWSEPQIVLSITDNWYESQAVWAPDVVRDEQSGLWYMAYTGVDQSMNQRICLAWSSDLEHWDRVSGNPQIEPDPALFRYVTTEGWAVCRDPYIYRADGVWNLLASARSAQPGFPSALLHATSDDLLDWLEPEIFMVNDSTTPGRVLESSTYLEREGVHHLFFHESGLGGVKHVYAPDLDSWTMANSLSIGGGIGPEVDSFDGGQSYKISRIGQFRDDPDDVVVHFVAHFGDLDFDTGDNHPDVLRTPALAREFAVFTGESIFGNPVLGDNPARRGEPPVGLVGNGYFGSREFFQGPLGYGVGGSTLGNSAQARLESHPFVVAGDSISLLIGGTDSRGCYVALMDAQADTILRRSYAEDNATMQRDYWDVQSFRGREAYILIIDEDPDAHLNVDDIIEYRDQSAVAVEPQAAPDALRDLGPYPNPFNPRTELRFALAADASFRARVHDLRGRLVWDSGWRPGRAGVNTVAWQGLDRGGSRAPGGVYLYRVEAAGQHVSGKLTLIP